MDAPATYRVTFPTPELAGPACAGCAGAGVLAEQMQMPTGSGRVLLVDVFCAVCGGCGSADPAHTACPPAAHAWHDDEDDDPDDDELPDGEEDRCPSCSGRGWFPVQGFTDAGDQMVMLRVPCGCTTDRAELVSPAGG